MVNTVANIITDTMILLLALWGQHWKSRADRLKDVIEYMVEEEIDERGSDQEPPEGSH